MVTLSEATIPRNGKIKLIFKEINTPDYNVSQGLSRLR